MITELWITLDEAKKDPVLVREMHKQLNEALIIAGSQDDYVAGITFKGHQYYISGTHSEWLSFYVPQNYSSIQQGIDAAVDGNIVLVDTGTYFENINFNGKAITLASIFIYSHDEFYRDNTIIDGSSPSNHDSASVVYFISGEDSTSILYGFTITGGSGTFSGEGWIDGGGIFVKYSGAKIVYNLIIDNDLYNDDPSKSGVVGGGIGALYMNASRPVLIENNIILDNDLEAVHGHPLGGGVAGFSLSQAWIHINNNLIRDNDCFGSEESTLGGGIYLETVNGSVNGNTIRNNSCKTTGQLFTPGGGLSFDAGELNSPYKLIMTNNIIDSNTVDGYYAYGAGVRARLGEVEIENNLITNNVIAETPEYNFGAGLCVYSIGQTGGFIRNNEFINNINNDGVGGGLFIRCWEIYQEILVDGNYFEGNIASTGGAVRAYDCGADFVNNVFINNSANYGGACALKGVSNNPVAHPYRMINNSFYDNDAIYGGAIYSDYGDPFIMNSIFYADTASSTGAEIRNLTGSLEIAYSNIDTTLIFGDFIAGHGIINEDPMFSTGSHPCMIEIGSPCRDAGIEEYTCTHDSTFLSPDHDRLWFPRPLGSATDIGAYELYPNPGIAELESRIFHNYPNPTQGIFNLHFTIDDLQTVSIRIYDLQGREVAMVVDRVMSAGEHTLSYDAGSLPAGMYFIRLQAGKDTFVRKLIVR